MKKKLTERDLNRIIMESTKNVLNEKERLVPQLQEMVQTLLSVSKRIGKILEEGVGNKAEFCLERAMTDIGAVGWLKALIEHYNGNDELFDSLVAFYD